MNLLNKKSLIIYFTHIGENYMSDGIRNIEKGNCENDIQRICKGATVLEGLPIQGSTIKSAKQKVENWIN